MDGSERGKDRVEPNGEAPRGSPSERDDFWSIDKLLPRRTTRRAAPQARPSPTPVEIALPDPRDPNGGTDPHGGAAQGAAAVPSVPLTVTARSDPFAAGLGGTVQGAEPVRPEPPSSETYEPDSLLLHRVQVTDWPFSYRYFDTFAKYAARFDVREPTGRMDPARAPIPVPFFSYIPQYVLMNGAQREWYLSWRALVRNGTYPETDYGYVLLYLLELINLPAEGAQAERRRDLMTNVWLAYRNAGFAQGPGYPTVRMDRFAPDWICDYCLIHRIPAPKDLIRPVLDETIRHVRLKEFFLSAFLPKSILEDRTNRQGRTYAEAIRILLFYGSRYDYRKSKLMQGPQANLLERTVHAAIAAAAPALADRRNLKFNPMDRRAVLTFDAYAGALCACRYKRKIQVTYTPISTSNELSFLVGDMVRYVENRVRRWIGARRMSVMPLPAPIERALNDFLDPLDRVDARGAAAERPAYEAQYDVPDQPASLTAADAIEHDSWETTRLLTEAFGGTGEGKVQSEPPPLEDTRGGSVPDSAPVRAEPDSEPEGVSGLAASLEAYAPFLRACLAGDAAGERACAAARGEMGDEAADEINRLTVEGDLGDIILEPDGSGAYRVIEDYREEVERILSAYGDREG